MSEPAQLSHLFARSSSLPQSPSQPLSDSEYDRSRFEAAYAGLGFQQYKQWVLNSDGPYVDQYGGVACEGDCTSQLSVVQVDNHKHSFLVLVKRNSAPLSATHECEIQFK